MKGWKLVPVEPTEEMQFSWNNGKTSTHQRLRERWVNALAAAPTPPAQPDELRRAAEEIIRAYDDGDETYMCNAVNDLKDVLEQKQ